jgi:hypothetical protein
MATVIDDDIWCCVDCLMLVANGDASGMDDETEARCTKGIESYDGYLVCNDHDDDKEFSSSPCDVCGSHLAGSRHHLAALGD